MARRDGFVQITAQIPEVERDRIEEELLKKRVTLSSHLSSVFLKYWNYDAAAYERAIQENENLKIKLSQEKEKWKNLDYNEISKLRNDAENFHYLLDILEKEGKGLFFGNFPTDKYLKKISEMRIKKETLKNRENGKK